jgi:uncharacterized protein YkwD
MLNLLVAAVVAATPQTTTIQLLNQERAAHGAPPLHADAGFARTARRHSRAMVAHHSFRHGSFATRGTRGEDIAWGEGAQSTPQAIVSAWMASPPHRATLLNPAYRRVGIGVAAGVPSGAADGATYTADFGS